MVFLFFCALFSFSDLFISLNHSAFSLSSIHLGKYFFYWFLFPFKIFHFHLVMAVIIHRTRAYSQKNENILITWARYVFHIFFLLEFFPHLVWFPSHIEINWCLHTFCRAHFFSTFSRFFPSFTVTQAYSHQPYMLFSRWLNNV